MSNSKIGIVDYGMGNIRSVMNAIGHLGGSSVLVEDPHQLIKYDKIVLPGVGAFGQAMMTLHQSGFVEALEEFRNTGKCILGICLGMQLLCKHSKEDGTHIGLGWFDAEVEPFPRENNLRVPHMGWNDVSFTRKHPVLNDIESGEDFYFVHSFYVNCNNNSDILGQTKYGITFPSVIHKENIIGMQFHPEKSQRAGLKIINNYIGV